MSRHTDTNFENIFVHTYTLYNFAFDFLAFSQEMFPCFILFT